MNEWGFAAQVKSWWDAEFARHPDWRFARCDVETKAEGQRGRSDLTVFSSGVVVLSGELRLPDHPSPSPWHPDNLSNAVLKATNHGARWAITSDATVLLLIDTSRSGPPVSRIVQKVELVPFSNRAELDSAAFLEKVKDAWLR